MPDNNANGNLYDLSPEGIENLRTLSSNLERSAANIQDCGNTLKNGISAMNGDLGVFEDRINDLVDEIRSAENKSIQAIEDTCQFIQSKIEKMEIIIGLGL